MSDNKIYKVDYQSDATTFLKTLSSDESSEAVNAEVKKYKRINELRDNPDATEPKSKLWEGF